MSKWLQAATKLTVVLCCSVAFAQDGADLLDDFATEVDVVSSEATETAAELDIDALATESNDVEILNVRLQDNGNLSGRLQVFYPTGKSEPADAKVAFTQSGQLVSSATTDDMGHFHVEGLEPGDYTATASVGEATTDFQVKVLAFDANAAPEEMFLEGTLTPLPEGEIYADAGCVDCGCADCGGGVIQGDVMYDEGIVYDEGIIMDEGMPCDTCGIAEEGYVVEESFVADVGCGAPVSSCGYSSGCGTCGGGGGGIGGRGLGLLGIGGLAAGITALAIDDDDPVSPAVP